MENQKQRKNVDRQLNMFEKVTINGITMQMIPRWSQNIKKFQLILTDVQYNKE